jgi:PAS domain S-box-containing protein
MATDAETEATLQFLFASNPWPMWIYDRDTLEILDVNEAAIQKYGYTRAEFMGMRLTELRPAEDIPQFLKQIEKDAGRPKWRHQSMAARHRLKSGECIDVDITSHTVMFAGRQAALALVQDVTERRLAAAALRQVEERMRFALEASRVGLWEVNLATGDTWWSETQEALHGLAAGTFAKTLNAFLQHVHEEDRELVRSAIGGLSAGSSGAGIVYRTASASSDAPRRWIRLVGRCTSDEDGRAVRAAGIALDITERHALEEQYRQAQKMEAVGRLAGGVAHDFNNLLTAILGFSEMTLDELGANHPSRRDVEGIIEAGKLATLLTQQLLALSRPNVHRPTVLEIGDVVASMESMLKRVLGENIRVRIVRQAAPSTVRIDAGQLQQIILNLAVNARDAMASGGSLTIETRTVQLAEGDTGDGMAPGAYVLLAVTDTGHGIDAETRARIFEPFFTTKPPGRGTGLGLPTVFGIVKQAGGNLTVASAPGQGATFGVHLPLVARETSGEAASDTDRTALDGRETVLLVEDDDTVRALVRQVLSRHAYVVLEAAHPRDALLLAARYTGRIDLMLTDLVMPDMMGHALAEAIQRARADVRVLFMSGYSSAALEAEGIGLADSTHFIQKPFSGHEILQAVRHALDVALTD